MQGKIIDRNVLPNRFTFYESDINTTMLIFEVAKINDGVDLTDKTAYLNIERDDSSTDKLILEKTLTDNGLYFSLMINDSITNKEGTVSAQISFENGDKSEIYKTNVFIFDVMNSVNGNESFEKTLPSAIDQLENKILNEISYCEQVKQETNDIKVETKSLKDQVEEMIGEYETNNVKSINGKKGDVSLTYEDVGAMPASGTIPKMQRTMHPLTIDDVSFDGSNPVNISLNGEFKQIDDEYAVVDIKNKGTYYVSCPKKVNIITDNFKSDNSTVLATVIINFKDVENYTISGDIEFSGDDAVDGKFIPQKNVYKFELFRLRNANVVYAKSLKYYKNSVAYEKEGTFNEIGYALEEGHTYNYGLWGNVLTNNYVVNIEDSIKGIGKLVNDPYDPNFGKYNLKLRTENNNILVMQDFKEYVGSLCISTDSQSGLLCLNGIVDVPGVIEIPLYGRAAYNSVLYFRTYSMGGYISTTNLSQLVSFEMWDTQKLVNEGEILGNNEIRPTTKEKFNSFRAYNKLVITINESAVGSVFVEAKYGLAVEISSEKEGFYKHYENTIDMYMNEPLLKIGDDEDYFDAYSGTITRKIKKVLVNKITDLEYDEATGGAVYRGEDGRGLIANGLVGDPNKTVKCSKVLDTNATTYILRREDDILLSPEAFGSYYSPVSIRFPLVFIYCLKTPKIEKVQVAPIKYYKGPNKVTVDTDIRTFNSFCRIVKKD